jgi:predicted nucleic acid-binding protein
VIIIDASALVDYLTDDGSGGDGCRREMDRDRVWSAPAHLHIESAQAIRGRLLGGRIGLETAEAALEELGVIRVRTPRNAAALLPRIWELRHNLTAYDAAYVALAEARGCTLVTADARLSEAPGLRCEVRLATA